MKQNVLILGLGKSGVSAANHALYRCDNVTIYAGKSTQNTKTAATSFIENGVPVIFDEEEVKGNFDLCVASPGIPQHSKFYCSALSASDEVISEPEYAFRQSPNNWIAITGTNGKTTTTSLVTHVFNECGKEASSCGNIGDTTIDAIENRKPNEVLVAEMSSYQLHSTSHFAPRTSALLNITPDHISWHGSFDAYTDAKLKIFENLVEGCTAVIHAELQCKDKIYSMLNNRDVRIIEIGTEIGENCAFVKDAKLVLRFEGVETIICNVSSLKIKGEHNVINAAFAAAIAFDFGLEARKISKALQSFNALQHRIEPVGTVNGVEFYNDSKATNVDATLQALTAFPKMGVYLLLGGRDKGTNLSALVNTAQKTCKEVIVYGEAGKRFFNAFEGSSIPCIHVAGMKDAFCYACKNAKSGDVVLLSPACASFDEFNSFEHRGDTFKKWVLAYCSESGK